MFYHIHFDEDNCPAYDSPMSHDVFFVSEDDINLCLLCKDIDRYKQRMDNGDNTDVLYEEYSDEGWHEKIDIALELLQTHYNYKVLDMTTMRSWDWDIN